jgi:stage V sporulation protein AF
MKNGVHCQKKRKLLHRAEKTAAEEMTVRSPEMNQIFEAESIKEKLDQALRVEENFDINRCDIIIGGRSAWFYFVDGFLKDEAMQKIMEHFSALKEEDMQEGSRLFEQQNLPYTEIQRLYETEEIVTAVLSGTTCLLIDGFHCCLAIDCRTYPARSVEEPEKDKVLRGSRDGFVETLVFNTALIRRRIRDPKLTMEIFSVGTASKSDVVLCYIEDRADPSLIRLLRRKLQNAEVDALTMNQESLAECIYHQNWWNPFPKFKYTERPDAAAAGILEGKAAILVDNSPAASMLPATLFDILEEADDYYFPPLTGTYLRVSRFLISILTLFLTPVWLLLMQHTAWIPPWLSFILPAETVYVPLVLQLLILEFAIDGLRLAAINTPSMLTTPLSVIAGIVVGEFAVNSGWFNSETMLYMAFVSIANYTQASYELGYAFKFFRILLTVLTSLFGLPGLIAGTICFVLALAANRTVDGGSYLAPLFPPDFAQMKRSFFRQKIRSGRNKK